MHGCESAYLLRCFASKMGSFECKGVYRNVRRRETYGDGDGDEFAYRHKPAGIAPSITFKGSFRT